MLDPERLDAFRRAVQEDPALAGVAADWLREQDLSEDGVIRLCTTGRLPLCVGEAYFGADRWQQLLAPIMAAFLATTVRILATALTLVPAVLPTPARVLARTVARLTPAADDPGAS